MRHLLTIILISAWLLSGCTAANTGTLAGILAYGLATILLLVADNRASRK